VKNYETLSHTVYYIIENVEIWEQSLQYSFANSLSRCIEEIILLKQESSFEDLINGIIKFFIKTITNEEKNLSDEYVKNFNDIIQNLKTGNRKIEIEKEIIDNCTTMGSFGKPSPIRRFSVYFCASIIRVKYYFFSQQLNFFFFSFF
jgi:hypothetical protein